MFSEVKFYVRLRLVFLLSATRPGRYLKNFWKFFSFFFFFRKTDPQSSNYLKYRREHVFLSAIVFVRHSENEMPLTINHGREMSTISGNDEFPLVSTDLCGTA